MNSIEVISPEDFRSDVFKVVNDKIELALDPVSSNLFKQSDKGLFVKKDGELHYREEFVVNLRNYSNDLLEFKLEDVDFVLQFDNYNPHNHLMLNSSWYRDKWFKKSITLDVGDATDSVTRQMPYTTSDTDHLTPYCAFVSHDLTTQNRLRMFASDGVDITIFDITLHRLEGDSSLLVVEVTKTITTKEDEEPLPDPGELGDKVLVATKVSNAAMGTDPFFLVTSDPDLLNCTLHAVGATAEGNPDFSNTLFTMPSYCPLSDVTPFFVNDIYGAIVTRDEIGRVYVRAVMVPDVISDVMSDYRPGPGEELKAGFSMSADYVVVGFENENHELNYCKVDGGQSDAVRTFRAPLDEGEEFVSSALDGGAYVVIIKKADGSYKCVRYNLVQDTENTVVELGGFDKEVEKVFIFSLGFDIIALQVKFPDNTSKWTVVGTNPMLGSAIPLTWTDTGYLADLSVSVNKFSIDINTFKISAVFLDYSTESLAVLTFNISDNNLSYRNVALPMEYLMLAMSGLIVPLFLTNGQIAFQEDATGTKLFLVEDGGDNTMYQTLAMFQGTDVYFVLAASMSGELSMFLFVPSNNKLIRANLLLDSANHLMDNTVGAPIAVHHESGSFTFLDKNLNVVLACPDSEGTYHILTVLGQADQNRPPNRLVLNQSLTEEGRFVTAWFTDTREVTVYKVAPDLTVTTNVIGLEELPEKIELDGSYIRDYVNCCQVDKYLVYALPTKQGEEKANNELLIIDLVTGTKKVVFHSEAGNWMTLGLTAIGETLFTTDTLVAPFPEGVNDYYQRKLWKVENDLTIIEMDSINIPYYDNTPDAIGANRYLTAYGEVLHDIGPTTNPDYPVYIDVVTHIPSAKMGVIRIESTEEITQAAGMFSANGLPMMGYFRFDEMGQPIGLCVQGDFNLSTFAFYPFDSSNGDGGGGEDNTPKEPRTLLGVHGDKGLMVNEANGDLYVAPFNSSQVVGSPVGASPSGNIPIIKKKLAIDSETGYYAYMKGWDVVFGSMGQDNVLANITVATTSREAEVAEITSIKSRDGTKVIFLIFIPAADLTGDAMHWRYEVDIMSGSVASKGLTRLNGRGGTISSAGIAITDKWIITHHPGEDGLIYLGPHDAGIVSKQYIPMSMSNTSIDRLVTIGDNLFGVVYKDNPNRELPFSVFEVSDDGKVETKYDFTVDTDKVLIGGGLGPNSAFRKLGPGKYRAAVTLIGSGDYYNHVGFIDLNEGGRSTMGGDLVTLPAGVNLENLYTTIIGSSVDKIFYQEEPSEAEPGKVLSPYLG